MRRSLNGNELDALSAALARIGHAVIAKKDSDRFGGFVIEPDSKSSFPIYLPGDGVKLSTEIRKSMLLEEGVQRFIHFIPSQHALTTLQNRKIYLRPIIHQSDWLEYEHCYAEAFAAWPLARLDQAVNGEWNSARAAGKDIFLLSMTHSSIFSETKDKFWQDYAGGNSTGVRIDLIMKPKEQNFWHSSVWTSRGIKPSYQLSVSKVVYDDGELLDNYKEVRTAMLRCGVETFLEGFSAIATRLKRQKFSWEREIRIVLDTSAPGSLLREKKYADYGPFAEQSRTRAELTGFISFKRSNSNGVEGAHLSFENDFFEINVASVEYGSKANNTHVNELKDICKRENIQCSKQQ